MFFVTRLRLFVAALGVLSLLSAVRAADSHPPIVFVHGNGDTAALWIETIWRFESNGWPADRLHAIDLTPPSARDDDAIPQPGRSSSGEAAAQVAAEVTRVRALHPDARVALVGNSRGGLIIRNYIQNLDGVRHVSHAVLGGTPNHGVWANPQFRPGNEFNGAGPFLTALNAPKGPEGHEVPSGVLWLTLRSDRQDKFAQTEGTWIGAPGVPTGVDDDSPALRGATNLVLPGRDHREVSYHREAFAATYRFITGHEPRTLAIAPTDRAQLSGVITGFGPGGPTNQPIPGAQITVFVVSGETGERIGPARHVQTVGADGRWGPYDADSTDHHEFVVSAPGTAITHVYRSPFPRSSSLVNFRPERPPSPSAEAAAIVVLTRPRGYFGRDRDVITLDGQSPPAGIPPGVPGVSSVRIDSRDATARPVVGEFASGGTSERIVGRFWPAAENRITVLELLY